MRRKPDRPWLLREPIGDELLLYDLRTHRAHAVQQPAAWLLDADDGRSARALAAEASKALGLRVRARDISAAREALAAIDLGRAEERRRGRRKALALAAATLTATLVAPRVAEAVSCGGVVNYTQCTQCPNNTRCTLLGFSGTCEFGACLLIPGAAAAAPNAVKKREP